MHNYLRKLALMHPFELSTLMGFCLTVLKIISLSRQFGVGTGNGATQSGNEQCAMQHLAVTVSNLL